MEFIETPLVKKLVNKLLDDEQILMLYIYPKSQQEELTSEQKKTLKLIAKRWTDEK